MAEWIRFDLAPPVAGRKTQQWFVVAIQPGEAIAEIKWYPGWRRYCFFPFDGTLYEQDCLRDIANFCEEQTQLYKSRD
jgi:hypothetical protein